mmetsp:Transcript_14691/g.44152  ORF Transcript_14691/g.44152 Transcript_14691/m.44152 type:complete len:97 (+) Transcript_14691:197-487(+)
MASALADWLNHTVSIITNDGRNIVGNLRGYDQTTNLILENCHERIFAPDAGVEEVILGLYIVRGDNVAVIGELDEAASAQIDLSAVRGEPLKPLVH